MPPGGNQPPPPASGPGSGSSVTSGSSSSSTASKKPSISVKYTKRGSLKVTVRARGTKLYRVALSASKAFKKSDYRRKSLRKRFAKKLKKSTRPKSARLSVSSKGLVSVRSRSKAKGATKFSFTVPKRLLQRQRSCKKKVSFKISAFPTSGHKYTKTQKVRPAKSLCGKVSKK